MSLAAAKISWGHDFCDQVSYTIFGKREWQRQTSPLVAICRPAESPTLATMVLSSEALIDPTLSLHAGPFALFHFFMDFMHHITPNIGSSLSGREIMVLLKQNSKAPQKVSFISSHGPSTL